MFASKLEKREQVDGKEKAVTNQVCALIREILSSSLVHFFNLPSQCDAPFHHLSNFCWKLLPLQKYPRTLFHGGKFILCNELWGLFPFWEIIQR